MYKKNGWKIPNIYCMKPVAVLIEIECAASNKYFVFLPEAWLIQLAVQGTSGLHQQTCLAGYY